jgi:hypothetical protein
MFSNYNTFKIPTTTGAIFKMATAAIQISSYLLQVQYNNFKFPTTGAIFKMAVGGNSNFKLPFTSSV